MKVRNILLKNSISMKSTDDELNNMNLNDEFHEFESSEPQKPKSNKNIFGVFGETVSIFFSKDLKKSEEILTDPNANILKKMAVLKDLEIRKIRELHPVLISMVKGAYNTPPEMRTSAARVLEKTGGIYSMDISSVMILDLLEIYMTTLENRLYQALHKMFLSMDTFPYYKYISKLLVNRFMPAGEINSMVWEVYSRALHLCFDFRYRELEHEVKYEIKQLTLSKDKSLAKLEQAICYANRVIDIANEVRDALCNYLEENKDGSRISSVLRYPSIISCYHDKTNINKLLQPVMEALLDPKENVRSYVLNRLEDIKTPVAYTFYRTVILTEEQPYPDVPSVLISILANLSLHDLSALDVFISFLSTDIPNVSDQYFDHMERICKLDYTICAKVVSVATEKINAAEMPDYAVGKVIAKLLPLRLTKESVDLLVNVALGQVKVSIASGALAARVLTRLNSPSFEYFESVLNTLDVILTHNAPHELKESVVKEIRTIPTVHNLACLTKSVYDTDTEIALLALETYLDIVKSGKVDHPVFVTFCIKLFGSKKVTPQILKTLEFLKGYQNRDKDILACIWQLVYTEDSELRIASMTTCHIWFIASKDMAERRGYLDMFMNLVSDDSYKWSDSYTKIVVLLSEYICSQDVDVLEHAENIMQRFKSALENLSEPEFTTPLCNAFEYIAENSNFKIRIQAEWIMDLILKNPNVSELSTLSILRIMATKLGLLFQYTKTLVKMVSSGTDEYKTRIFEIIAEALASINSQSYIERNSALQSGEPRELAEFAAWEAQFNRELLPIIYSMMKLNYENVEMLKLALTILKRIESARKIVNFIFEFRLYPFNSEICPMAVDAVASLLYPPFSLSEQKKLYELSAIASNDTTEPELRKAAVVAIGKIGDMSQYKTLVALTESENESLEIRAEAIKALNAFSSPVANDIYAKLLALDSTPDQLKELMLDGLVKFGDSRIIPVFTKMLHSSISPRLKELCKAILSDRGYGEVVAINSIYSRRAELDRERKDSLNKMKVLEKEGTELPDSIAALQTRSDKLDKNISILKTQISMEQDKLAKFNEKWEATKNRLVTSIREIAPSWPSDIRVAPERREIFIEYQEKLRAEKDKYEAEKKSFDDTIQKLQKDFEYINRSYKDNLVAIDGKNKRLLEINQELNERKAAMPDMVKEMDTLLKQSAKMEESFRNTMPSIDESNHEALSDMYDMREKMWKARYSYYLFLSKKLPELK